MYKFGVSCFPNIVVSCLLLRIFDCFHYPRTHQTSLNNTKSQEIPSSTPTPVSSMAYRPVLTRQESVRMTKEKSPAFNCISTIAAIIIGFQYDKDTSPCTDGTEYLIDPQTYLLVAGFVSIGWTVYVVCIQCGGIIIDKCIDGSGKMRIACTSIGVLPFVFCVVIWQAVWASLGLYMYANQMNEDCQGSDTGIMILSWGIIAIIGCGCLVCVVCCAICAIAIAASGEEL